MISIHGIDHLYAKRSELPGGNWVEVYFCSKTMGETSVCFYFESVDLASAFHDMINNLPTQENIDVRMNTLKSLNDEGNSGPYR